MRADISTRPVKVNKHVLILFPFSRCWEDPDIFLCICFLRQQENDLELLMPCFIFISRGCFFFCCYNEACFLLSLTVLSEHPEPMV